MSELAPTQTNENPLKLVIVDQSRDALSAARDEADRRLTEELNEGGKFKHFMNGIWKGNLAKNYYRAKYTLEAKDAIEDSQDVLLFNSDSTDKRSRAMETTIDRFQSDYDELIHTDAGERRDTINDSSEAVVEVKALIKKYCNGSLSDENIVEEKTRLLQALRDSHGPEGLSKSVVTVDNIVAIARSVKAAVEHGESLDNTINSIQFISGEALNGVRSEAKYNTVEKIIDKLSQTKIGSVVGPNTIIAATTIAASLLKVGSHSVVGAVTKTILPGVGAGLWSGIRENKRMKDDRAQHMRESAQGEEFSVDSKRRTELEATRYDTLTANELTEHLKLVGSDEVLNDGGKDALQAALEALAAAETRIKISDRNKLDLITFTDAASIGDERLNLDITRAKLKVALNERLTQDRRQELGLDASKNVSEILSEQSTTYAEVLEGEINEKDKIFNKLKSRNVAKAAVTGVLTGITFGLISQEIVAAADPTRTGLLEQIWNAKNTTVGGVEHQTILNGIISGDQVINRISPSGTYELADFSGESKISVSSDHSLMDNHDGTFSLIDKSGNISANHIAVNADGTFSDESLRELHELGMTVSDESFTSENIISHTTEVDAEEYVNKHLTETVHVTRDFHYDNDSSVSDKNEMRLHWGGNNGVAADGGFEMSVARMTAEGSVNGENSIDWQQAAASGELKLAISATADTQSQVFMVDISPDGNISIPEGSPAAEFFSNEDGKAVFHGAYAEVVHVAGVDENGIEHIRPLATAVGDQNPGMIQDIVSETIKTHHAVYEITTSGYETTSDVFTEMSPIIPINSRRSLENAEKQRGSAEYSNSYNVYNTERSAESNDDSFKEEVSPRLNNNPSEKLIPAQEFSFYKELLLKKRGEKYLTDIENIVKSTPELNLVDSNIEAIVKVPVNAAGDLEAGHIYDVITKAYGTQKSEALIKSLILLHVNWFDEYPRKKNETDSDYVDRLAQTNINIAKTRDEIARAKAALPGVKIAVIETEWKRAEISGGVIGHVSRKLNDVALLTLQAAVEAGRMSQDHDVLLIRNDADPKGLAVNYLGRYIDEFNKNPNIDVFTGTTSFDNKKAERAPGMVFAGNFMQSLNLISSSRYGTCHTGGANFGVRASTFAAVGAIGFDEHNTGAGSDDVSVGVRVVKARRVGDHAGDVNYSNHGYSETVKSTSRRVAMRVHGARIDTDSDREEVVYRKGIPMINTWDEGFDAGNYANRNDGLKTGFSESLGLNFKSTIERIQNDMQGTIRVYGGSTALTRTALAFTFPSSTATNPHPPYYELFGDGRNCNFKITKAGAKYLKQHLSRGSGKKKERYGTRKMRQLYGVTNKPTDGPQKTNHTLINVS